ncbi:hypothetical protein [Undibacterium sp. Ren11W]|uniref:hypothetical protein n=1 Tax=Undibacterium sp. Ren11W TaxID=3413045 RepID=UPI003BF0D2FC
MSLFGKDFVSVFELEPKSVSDVDEFTYEKNATPSTAIDVTEMIQIFLLFMDELFR